MPEYTIPTAKKDVEYSEDAQMSSDSGSDCEFSETQSSKRRLSSTSVQKPRKKAGRKCITASSDEDKKIARNRKAQRAFRERKEQYLHGLEEQVKQQAAKIQELMEMNERLKRDLDLASSTRATNNSQDSKKLVTILSPTLSNGCMESHPDLCTRQDSPLHSPNHDLLSSFLLQQAPPPSTFSAASTLLNPTSPYNDDFNSLFCISCNAESFLTPSSLLLQPQEQTQNVTLEAYWNSLLASSAADAVKQETTPLV
ncbi:UNVERIFIED_CONTAM: hypothetical protein HDU68_001716 [Siphonaria sp. JEL0065]|nr:hypothetical protein HDU68_001716 [Siphonaria sp. JEL0065]